MSGNNDWTRSSGQDMLPAILQPRNERKAGPKAVTVTALVSGMAVPRAPRRRLAESNLEPLEISRDQDGLLLSGSEEARGA